MTVNTEILALGIEGMTCGSCQRRVEHALRGVPGVVDATVDLASGAASVRYEPSRTSATDVFRAVRGAGYEPTAPGVGVRARPRRSCCS